MPTRYMDRVEHWDDERREGNGIFVSLKNGWCFEPEQHVLGFDSVKEAREAVKGALPCRCKTCSVRM